jgi:hypothetical protein
MRRLRELDALNPSDCAQTYESLRQEALRRYGSRCQLCGTMSKLEVHPKPFRNHSGYDSEETDHTLQHLPCIRSQPDEIGRSRLHNAVGASPFCSRQCLSIYDELAWLFI